MAAWLLGIFVLVLVAGLALIRLGWRGRRINRDPVCKDCGFNLHAFRLPDMHALPAPTIAPAAIHSNTPSTTDPTHPFALGAPQDQPAPLPATPSPAPTELPITITCPECGGGLKRPKAIRIGERKRMPIMAATGLLMALLAIAPLGAAFVAVVTGSDLSKNLPANVLIWHSRFATREVSRAIAIELESRLLAKKLDNTQASLVVERALELQADWQTPWLEEWGAVIEAAKLNQQLDAEQSNRYHSHATKIELVTREGVRPGDPLPVRARIVETRACPSETVHTYFVIEKATLDEHQLEPLMQVVSPNKPLQPRRSLVTIVTGSKSRSRGAYIQNSNQAVLLVPDSVSPGQYELVLRLKVTNWDDPQGKVYGTQVLSTPVTIASRDQIAIEQVPADSAKSESLSLAFSQLEVTWTAFPAGPRQSNGSSTDALPLRWRIEGLTSPFSALAPAMGAIHANVYMVDAKGQEVLIGLLSSEPTDVDDKTRNYGYFRWDPRMIADPGSAPLELIVRPDLESAMHTYTIRKLYMGEFRVKLDNVLYQEANRRTTSKDRSEIEALMRSRK